MTFSFLLALLLILSGEEARGMEMVSRLPRLGTITREGSPLTLSCSSSSPWFFCLWHSPVGGKQCAIQEDQVLRLIQVVDPGKSDTKCANLTAKQEILFFLQTCFCHEEISQHWSSPSPSSPSSASSSSKYLLQVTSVCGEGGERTLHSASHSSCR